MNRESTDWGAVRCPTCGTEYVYTDRVPAPAGDGYPVGVRVATCSVECASRWVVEHRRQVTRLFEVV